VNPALERQRAQFDQDPGQVRAFEALEEHHFLQGEWAALVELYRHRLGAPDLAHAPEARARLLHRLGLVLEERCEREEEALAAYEEAARLAPTFPPVLRQLRALYRRRGRWELVLQVGELEAPLPMEATERASLEVELGEAWLGPLGDPEQALAHFRRALAAVDHGLPALRGSARALEALGRAEDALHCWEEIAARTGGEPGRQARLAQARIHEGSLRRPDRALDLYASAVAEDPDDDEVVAATLAAAIAAGRWELVGDLAERRFDRTEGARARVAVALETAEILLGRGDVAWARSWLARAAELAPEDAGIALARAEAAEREGDGAARLEQLRRAFELDPGRVPPDALQELAESHLAGDGEEAAAEAAELLRRAVAAAPERTDLLDALVRAEERAGRFEELIDLLEARASGGNAGEAGTAPERARTLAQVALVHERHRQDEEAALDAWRRAFAANPAVPGAALALDRLLRKAEAWEELAGILERACEAAPEADRPALLCSRGELALGPLRRSEDPEAPERARCAFEEALALEPGLTRALEGLERLAAETGDEGALLRAFEREAERTRDPERRSWLTGELARRLAARGEAEAAVVWAERLAAEAPADRGALELCASLHEQLGRDAELAAALVRLDAVLEGRERAAVQRRLAALHERAGREAEAVAARLASVEADPEDVESLRALVEPLERAGRFRELSRVLRSLAARVPAPEHAVLASRLAEVLAERLQDPDAAIVVLWRLVEDADAPSDVDERLETLLDRTGRHEELVQRLSERSQTLEADSPEALELDLRRAELLSWQLHQHEQAAALYRRILEAVHDTPDSEPLGGLALEGLERCARSAGDAEELVRVLDLRATEGLPPPERDALLLERARLLEEDLEAAETAARAYGEIADARGPGADEARQRLVGLLERSEHWAELRERLEESPELRATPDAGEVAPGADTAEGHPDTAAARALHARLADLCAEKLGDREGALAHLEAVARLAPGDPEPWWRLAELYREAGRPADARTALERELATSPEPERERVLHSTLALLCRDVLDDADAARAHFECLLTLDPGHGEAVDFLAERYEAEGQTEALTGLLRQRLERLEAGARPDPERAAALRLRLARLEDRPEAAIAVLAPALDGSGLEPAAGAEAAALLADLYLEAGDSDALVRLARQRVELATEPGPRADWCLRLGGGLREAGDHPGAVAAYREALGLRPGDASAERALCELHREAGEHEALARLLEAQLAGVAGAAEIPLRLELAEILAKRLERPAEGLLHLRRILEIEPDRAEARARALALAERAGAPEVLLELLDLALAVERDPDERASLLHRRGMVLAGPLDRIGEAMASFREAVGLRPSDTGARRALRDCLERAGDWAGLVDALHAAARWAEGDERVALLEEGARIAGEHLSADASLPWLERLRAERPDDPGIPARMADVHRRAGRPESLLRALEAEIALRDDSVARRDLHRERARVLERELGSPVRALAALECALQETPDHPETLAELERVYAGTGRTRERAEVLERRVELVPPPERGRLLRELGELRLDVLGEPQGAVEPLRGALEAEALPRAAGLQTLGRALRRARDAAAWASVAEAELDALDPDDEVVAERRRTLHGELAHAYARELGDPDTALAHLRALVDAPEPDPDDEVARAERRSARATLLDRLRAEGAHAELARRLADRLREEPEDVAGWLELGYLREERLHQPAGAEEAYAAALAREPECLEALRALRRVATRSGDWEKVAETLERELALALEAPAARRAELLRALGAVARDRLGSTTRASRAYAAALEADPEDRASLHALQELSEAVEDWQGAIELYTRELDVLAPDETPRARELHLRTALLARDRTDEPERAVASFEAADAIEPLAPAERRSLAELHRRRGDGEAFARVLADWCDDGSSGADAADHLELADALDALGRRDDALARVERALEHDATETRLWLAAARLREALGDPAGAAEALGRAAETGEDADAARWLLRAALLVEAEDAEVALESLRRSVARDAGSAAAHAALARVAEACGVDAEAAEAAARALDLAAAGAALDREERLTAAVAGGRAARAVGELEAAARLCTTARALAPDAPEVLAAEGEVLFAMGELAGARRALEARLAVTGAEGYPERAAHLALLAASLEASGEVEPALARYREARALEPDRADARAGEARLLERAGDLEAALGARLDWAEGLGGGERADQLARAAELELARGAGEAGPDTGAEDRAEAHLRAALAADPGHPDACLLLTTRLTESGRTQEALELAARGLERARTGEVRARLASLQGRILEQGGERRKAAEAYGLAAEADPRSTGSVLAQARILRALGAWDDATRALRRFADAHPGDDPTALARVHFQRGRLLAGPLERVDEALEAYRRALEANPRFRDARHALATLLLHRSEHWDEALTRLRELLEETPENVGFLRGALRIAEGRGDAAGVARGLAILRALGVTSPEEARRAPERLELAVGEPAVLDNPVWERARRIAASAADEIARALEASGHPAAPEAPAADPLAAFRAAAVVAEGELSAPALVPLDDEGLAEVLRVVAGLASDADHVHGDGHRVNALARELGRRARRRVRRELGDVPVWELGEIDYTAWRRELRTLAHARALDAGGGDLRAALRALVETGEGRSSTPGPEDDLTDLVAADPAARALLRRVVLAWLGRLA